MEQSTPAPQLVNGLRHLWDNVRCKSDVGLNDVVCGETDLIGFRDDGIDYCGIDIRQLCDEGCFESVIWLLLHQYNPDAEELADATAILAESAVVDEPLAEMIGAIPLQVRPLDLFPLSIQLLSCFDPTPGDRSLAASQSQYWRVLAQLPVLMHVAFGGRLTDGRAFPTGEVDAMSFAGRLLQILRDDNTVPTAAEEHAMNVVMICECLTEMRAACFSARLFGSTVNDIVAGLKSASSMFVSQLRNDPFAWAAELLQTLKSPDDAERWWNARQKKAMPFGFSDIPEDVRSEILRVQCRELLGSLPGMVMEASAARLESLLARDGVYPTTDWTAARVLSLLNVPSDRISLAIGIARTVGWAAQATEQHRSGIPLIPRLHYCADDRVAS